MSEFLHVAFNFVREHNYTLWFSPSGLQLVFKKNKAKLLSQRDSTKDSYKFSPSIYSNIVYIFYSFIDNNWSAGSTAIVHHNNIVSNSGLFFVCTEPCLTFVHCPKHCLHFFHIRPSFWGNIPGRESLGIRHPWVGVVGKGHAFFFPLKLMPFHSGFVSIHKGYQ